MSDEERTEEQNEEQLDDQTEDQTEDQQDDDDELDDISDEEINTMIQKAVAPLQEEIKSLKEQLATAESKETDTKEQTTKRRRRRKRQGSTAPAAQPGSAEWLKGVFKEARKTSHIYN